MIQSYARSAALPNKMKIAHATNGRLVANSKIHLNGGMRFFTDPPRA